MAQMTPKTLDLFGGSRAWDQDEWTASDDRVRGGASQSHLSPSPDLLIARFHGTLDTSTLKVAGFASQRTTAADRTWDLSAHSGILLRLVSGDRKKYTLTLKDTLLPPAADGREQSTVSHEHDFYVPRGSGAHDVFVPWSALRATFRGREAEGAPALDVRRVRRFSVMMRSFFTEQQGEFELEMRSISAYTAGGGKGADEEAVGPRWSGRGWRRGVWSVYVAVLVTVVAGYVLYRRFAW